MAATVLSWAHNPPSTTLSLADVHVRVEQGQTGENHTCITQPNTHRETQRSGCQRCLLLWLNLRLRLICALHVCEYELECTWPCSSVTVKGYKGILFVLTLIARSGQQKPCNPTAIITRLIDSIGTERVRQRDQEIAKERERWKGRSLLLCPSLSLSLTV